MRRFTAVAGAGLVKIFGARTFAAFGGVAVAVFDRF
ncbi:MAG: hypothetical protein RL738_221, partial [Bacteroidota bacterium]